MKKCLKKGICKGVSPFTGITILNKFVQIVSLIEKNNKKLK